MDSARTAPTPASRRAHPIAAIALSALVASCGQVGHRPARTENVTPSGQDAAIVTLYFDDWRIERADQSPIPAGDVVFRLVNEAGRRHEFVIVRLGDDGSHPPLVDGRLDEDQFPEEHRVTEIDTIPPHAEVRTRLHLVPGEYLVFCNIVEREDGRILNHFGSGMHIRLEVR